MLDEVLRDKTRMVARATCDDIHAVDGCQFVVIERQLVELQMAVHHAAGKRVANRARLLVDFLQHEIGETTLFSCGNIPINMRDGWVDFATFLVEILNRRLAVRKRELREGAVFEHDHIARLVDERHDIARDERAAFAWPTTMGESLRAHTMTPGSHRTQPRCHTRRPSDRLPGAQPRANRRRMLLRLNGQ